MNPLDTYVSVILPSYNEEEAIGGVIDDIKSVMEGSDITYEIIVVDDASTDKTVQIAEERGVQVIRQRLNRGAGSVRKKGILNANGKIIVMLDADGSYDPADILKLLKYIPEYDQVNGLRRRETGFLKFLRIPVKWLIQALASYLSKTKIQDLNTGLKAFKKDIMMKYLWVIPDGFSCVTTMTLAFLCNGYSVKWVPCNYYIRKGKSKFNPISDTINYINTVIRIIVYFNPLRVFTPLSLSLLILGIGKSIFDWVFLGHKIRPSDVTIILAGIIIGGLGFLADLIVSQTKARGYELPRN